MSVPCSGSGQTGVLYHPGQPLPHGHMMQGRPVPNCSRRRTNFTKQQLGELEKAFEKTHHPDVFMRVDLGIAIGLNESRVQGGSASG